LLKDKNILNQFESELLLTEKYRNEIIENAHMKGAKQIKKSIDRLPGEKNESKI